MSRPLNDVARCHGDMHGTCPLRKTCKRYIYRIDPPDAALQYIAAWPDENGKCHDHIEECA